MLEARVREAADSVAGFARRLEKWNPRQAFLPGRRQAEIERTASTVDYHVS
jgi:hypothetical protein